MYKSKFLHRIKEYLNRPKNYTVSISVIFKPNYYGICEFNVLAKNKTEAIILGKQKILEKIMEKIEFQDDITVKRSR
jgi:hypothetical protein